MITRVNSPQVWQRWKEAKRLALLATFEDSVTGTRVKEFCQGLARNLGQQCQIVEHVWLFGTLRLRELQEIAAEEASTSDLIIISVHQAEGLPDEVKSWIDLWLPQKGPRQAVLVALLDPPYEGASGSTEAYLQEIARRGGMEFLVESADETAPP
ncbi:MAG: hypothetical protein ACLQU3_07405 [Limisphaerales bacterium]